MAYSYTFHDAIEHLLRIGGGNVGVNNDGRILSAINSAYRELTEIRNWNYLYDWDQILTDAPYTTGTLAYTASNRTVTLTGGTFPTWAPYGWLYGLTGTTLCPVESYTDSTHIILAEDFAPTSDGSASSYRLYHTEYPLDEKFQALSDVFEQDGAWHQSYLSHGEWLMMMNLYQGSGQPLAWTIGRARQPTQLHRNSFFIYPPPDSARRIQFVYKRRARDLRIGGRASIDYTGTIANTGTAVTGTGTSFNSTHVGAMIRIAPAGATQPPTGPYGVQPFEYEGRIKAVGSTTGLTLEASWGTNISGRKFRITDPVDMEPFLEEAFLRSIEYELAVQTDQDKVPLASQIREVSLDRAYDRDHTDFTRRFVGMPGLVIDRMATWPNEAT